MASSDTLRERVAEEMAVILSGEPDWGIPRETDEAWQLADAAIRVVLAAVAEQIETLPEEAYYTVEGKMRALDRADVLAVVARLGRDADSAS